MKSKQELKKVFENGDKPKQEDFWELIDSYFHRNEPLSLEELSLLKSNLATIDKNIEGVEIQGNVDTKEQVSAKIETAINALKANAPETYDTLKEIADYIANDSNAGVALLQIINAKLNQPTMTNNYYGLWDDTNKKFIEGNLYKTDSGLTKTDQALVIAFPSYNCSGLGLYSKRGSKSHYNGGLATIDEDGQIVDAIVDYSGFERYLLLNNSMILNSNNRNSSLLPFDSDDIKTKNLSFTLQTSITPTPNTLVPKTDGNGLIWYNSSSVGYSIAINNSNENYIPYTDSNGVLVNSIIHKESSYDDSVFIGGNSYSGVRLYNGNTGKLFRHTAIEWGFPSNITWGDTFFANWNLWVSAGNRQTINGGNSIRKLIGLEYDDVGSFNTIWNFNTYGEDWQSKGFAQLVYTGSYYGDTILNSAPLSVGIDSRMRQGALFNFCVNGQEGKTQMYVQGNNIFTRQLNWGDTTSSIWQRYISEAPSTTTQLTEKLALARVKLKSYTKSERNALSNQEIGEMIWQTDNGNSGIRVFDGTNWLAVQTTID